MESLPEFVGTVHIFLGPYRGNPIALYIRQDSDRYKISPRIYPWNRTIGIGENPNKAAADFEINWKKNGLSPDMYSGPHWEGGIKPEKPKPAPPPKPAAPTQKPEAKTEPQPEAQTSATSPTPPSAPPPSESDKSTDPPPATDQGTTA
ncbi:MAG: hypothetical protein JSU59_06055 [Nitrospirota bacterium]|nr:MAG: hypothetical protein JSU59_06055 [Nitrospirota bacterium]